MTEKKNPQALAGAGAVLDTDDTTVAVISAKAIGKLPPQYQKPNNLRDTRDSLIRDVVYEYLGSLDPDNPPEPEGMDMAYMEALLSYFLARNATAPKEDRWKVPEYTPAIAVAFMMLWRDRYVRIDFSDGEEREKQGYVLARYNQESGIYEEVNEDDLSAMVQRYHFDARESYVNAVERGLRNNSPVVYLTRDRNVDMVRNGIRDRRTGELMPFTPDRICVVKTAVDWEDNPPLPVIHNDEDGTDWDPDTFMRELANYDPEMELFLWRLYACSLRPYMGIDQVFNFYSRSGNSGKGTFCALVRNTLGAGNHTSIAVAEWSNDHFMLGDLPFVNAVICDENQVGDFIKDTAAYKASVTHDSFRIDRKHKKPIMGRFHGIIIECWNDAPRVKDKTDSFWRRNISVEFEQCFTGRERKYIKNDYLKRPEVLRYMQWKALSMDFETLTVPAKCIETLEQFKIMADPVRDFATNVIPELKWDAWPRQFLYDLYKGWMAVENPSGKPQGRNTFYADLDPIMVQLGHAPYDRSVTYDTATYAAGPEPYIVRYDLKHWMPRGYIGLDFDRKATPDPSTLGSSFSGYARTASMRQSAAGGDSDA